VAWFFETRCISSLNSHVAHRYSNHLRTSCSSEFKLSIVKLDKITEHNLRLLLARDVIESKDSSNKSQSRWSQWLRLSLVSNFGINDKSWSKNICTAWIFGKSKERMCMLSKGFSHPGRYLFTNPEFVLYDDLFDKDRGLLCDDSLTIVCQVYAITYSINYVDSWLFHPEEPTVTHHTENTLGKDLKRMLDTGQGSDVTLVASDGKEFPAHTFILSSRSPVFSAMFEHGTKEKQEKRVTIEDLDSGVVSSLLDFMYTDSVLLPAILDPQLLFAANKYQIPTLKTVCEESMIANLTLIMLPSSCHMLIFTVPLSYEMQRSVSS